VTHDPRRAVELSDRALVLHRGCIRARPAREGSGAEANFEVEALRRSLASLAIEANGVAT
jgi:ABC-type sulfate/molybdate transport systems ATPase subunit